MQFTNSEYNNPLPLSTESVDNDFIIAVLIFTFKFLLLNGNKPSKYLPTNIASN